MSARVEIDYVGEGPSDGALARRLIHHCGGIAGTDYITTRRGRGKGDLDKRLAGFNLHAAHTKPILVLRDLDQDAACAGAWLATQAIERHPDFLLRLAMRSAEAWAMADAESLRRALKLPRRITVPREPETLPLPKDGLIRLIESCGRPDIKRQIGIEAGGPGVSRQALAGWLSDFFEDEWDVGAAINSGTAPSLARCALRLQEVIDRQSR
jgi:hypothetical protein